MREKQSFFLRMSKDCELLLTFKLLFIEFKNCVPSAGAENKHRCKLPQLYISSCGKHLHRNVDMDIPKYFKFVLLYYSFLTYI